MTMTARIDRGRDRPSHPCCRNGASSGPDALRRLRGSRCAELLTIFGKGAAGTAANSIICGFHDSKVNSKTVFFSAWAARKDISARPTTDAATPIHSSTGCTPIFYLTVHHTLGAVDNRRMLKGLKAELRLRWKIHKLGRQMLQRVEDDNLTDEQVNAIINEWSRRDDLLTYQLLAVLTARVRTQADWWTVDLPSRDERPDWWTMPENGIWHLTHRGLARAKKLVRNERREYVGWLVDRVVSVLALLVALAAVLAGD